MTKLRIEYRRDDGLMPVDECEGKPIVRCYFGPSPDLASDLAATKAREVIALIDTGADYIYGDPVLLTGSGCKLTHMEMRAGGIGSDFAAQGFEGFLFFPKANVTIKVTVISSPLRSSGRTFDLVLGTRFLKFGRLSLDFMARKYSFEFGDSVR